jgi:hypothetical protein
MAARRHHGQAALVQHPLRQPTGRQGAGGMVKRPPEQQVGLATQQPLQQVVRIAVDDRHAPGRLALRAAGKPVEYLTFQGDGHGNQKWNNKLAMYRKTEDFLAGCLGGRSSGFDYYQLGAWLF